jgi:hypothetical protein
VGFLDKWITLVMSCVSTVSYSILFYGSPSRQFFPTREIRQGDPLSPYLFLLVVEGLSSLVSRVVEDGRISGVHTSAKGLKLSHLFFVDDSLLFCQENFQKWSNLMQVMLVYEQASGQKLNSGKTSIYFRKNTRGAFKNFITNSTGISSIRGFKKYLGLPTMVGHSKTTTFAGILGRVQKKLDGLKERFLSQAGKEVLIKAVVQAIPTKTKILCKRLNSLISKFWWGHKHNTTKAAWLRWDYMGKPNSSGGMGFRDLEVFNLALLAKQGWRLVQQPDSLVARVLQDKYFRGSDFMHVTKGRNISYAWRSIINAQEVLDRGLVWRVGDRTQIRV